MPGPLSVSVKVPAPLQTAGTGVRAATERAVADLTALADREAKTAAVPSRVTGTLMRTIIPTVASAVGETKGVLDAAASYARFVEEGTGPGHESGTGAPYTPPFAPIAAWAAKRGINPRAVWSSIRKRGTRPHPFMRPAAEKVLPLAAAKIAAAIRAALGLP